MKAVVQHAYGDPGAVLQLRDVAVPGPAEDEVLVRVMAASLNVLDWRRVRAAPAVVRPSEGLRRPRRPVLGVDVAGVVERAGPAVQGLRAGDAVFGVGKGSFAEYTVARTVVPKPDNLSFEQAAAVPVAGLTALQALRHKGQLEAGQQVAVSGAGGGVGTFAVQLARAFGARVTAVTSGRHVDLVATLGADRVVRYDTDDFTAHGPFDLIIDVSADRPISACLRALTPAGRLVLVGAGRRLGGPVGRMAAGALRQRLLRQRVVPFISWESVADLEALSALLADGRVTPVIDRTYPLAETVDAIRYLESEQAQGKVVVTP